MHESADRDALIAELTVYYSVNPRLFRPMELATLERAWRVIHLHESWRP